MPISTVVLSSQRVPLRDALFSVKQKLDPAAASPLVHDGQKLVPSVTRVFSRARELYVFLQAYQRSPDGAQRPMRPLAAYVALYSEGRKVFESAPIAISEGLDPRTRAIPIRFSVGLQTVEPGTYECQVTVLDPEIGRATFWRAPIAVVM